MENTEIYDSVLTTKMLIEKLKELEEDFPEEAIERSDGKKTGKFYNTTGIGYQWCADRMNKVLGIPHWRTIHETNLEKGTFGSGKESFHATCSMTIQIITPTNQGVNVLAERFCYGGHISKSEEDALKGAFTNAFKKTVALFGVGASAYRGTIDDDNAPLDEVPAPRTQAPRTAPAKPSAPKNPFARIYAIKSAIAMKDEWLQFILEKKFKVASGSELNPSQIAEWEGIMVKIQTMVVSKKATLHDIMKEKGFPFEEKPKEEAPDEAEMKEKEKENPFEEDEIPF